MGQPQVALGAAPAALRRAILAGHSETSEEGRARLAFWQAATAGAAPVGPGLDVALAEDILELRGLLTADEIRARRGPMLDRAAARLRAAAAAPVPGLRQGHAPDDVAGGRVAVPFAGFFAVELLDLSWRRFDGSFGPMVRREVFVGCDAVTVLPYDPMRDRVLVIEQLRAGPIGRGDPNPWQIEAVAGRIDAGETAEDAARREAVEEAGLALDRLVRIGAYYPTPGAVTEYIYSFIGLCNLPDGVAGVHGMAAEAEDIRGHLLDFAEAQARLEAGEIGNAPLILTLQWLGQNRARLRAEAAGRPGI